MLVVPVVMLSTLVVCDVLQQMAINGWHHDFEPTAGAAYAHETSGRLLLHLLHEGPDPTWRLIACALPISCVPQIEALQQGCQR